jgi:hypothetical protein
MTKPLIYIDTSYVRDGQQKQLMLLMKDLEIFVKNNMPRIISYSFFLNENESKMAVVAIHPDSNSLESHLNTGNEKFRKFKDIIELQKIQVYGEVTNNVVKKLQKKALMLGKGTVEIYNFFTGFSR